MSLPRPFALVLTADQWRRAAHDRTALVGDVVQLAWTDGGVAGEAVAEAPLGAGLVFDDHCRLYHSQPGVGQVERLLWAAGGAPEPLFGVVAPAPAGEFEPVVTPDGPLRQPRGLAVDAHERLYIAEAHAGRVLIVDLWSRQLVGVVPVPGRPTDLARQGGRILAVLEAPDQLVAIDGTGGLEVALPSMAFTGSARVAVGAGGIFLLERAGTAAARILSTGRPVLEVPHATDLEFAGEQELVVARRPGEDFRRFRVSAGGWEEGLPLKAARYDGRGIVRTPDGRIAFWTDRGVRHAVAARVTYATGGRVTTFRLDSGTFRTTWGRLFVDACIPEGTRLLVHAVATDEPLEEPTLARTPPANATAVVVARPDLSAPMPPLSWVPADEEIGQPFHRRETGRELPWTPPDPMDGFETYEAPIRAEAGRFLWITLKLVGTSRSTPRLRALRAEHPSHDLLRRLPRVYSREAEPAEFLRRYLALADGVLSELEGRAVGRHALVNPGSVPEAALEWLAGFVGLALDARWPAATQRQLIREAVWLFRFRGTVPGLKRFLEICLGRPVIVIEKFRARGLGGAFLGEAGARAANSIVGAGFRVGGAVGEPEDLLLGEGAEDAFETHAHRFTVILPMALSEDQLAGVRLILDRHRPAHTLVDVCTVASGLRVGRGVHVELNTVIGRSSGFRTLQVDQSLLGRDAILGRVRPGTVPGQSRVQHDLRVG